MLIKAILVGLIGVIAILDSRLLGRLNLERPLISATPKQDWFGDLTTGLIVGATLELVSLGLVNVGAAAPPDMNLGAIIATAFTILTGATPETALTIAIPIAVLGQLLGILLRTLLASLTRIRADALVKNKEISASEKNPCCMNASLLMLYPIFIPIFQ